VAIVDPKTISVTPHPLQIMKNSNNNASQTAQKTFIHNHRNKLNKTFRYLNSPPIRMSRIIKSSMKLQIQCSMKGKEKKMQIIIIIIFD